MVQDGNSRISSKDEIAVHAMNEEYGVTIGRRGGWYSPLSRREALSNHSTTIDTASARRVPELPTPVRYFAGSWGAVVDGFLPCIGEDILITELVKLEVQE